MEEQAQTPQPGFFERFITSPITWLVAAVVGVALFIFSRSPVDNSPPKPNESRSNTPNTPASPNTSSVADRSAGTSKPPVPVVYEVNVPPGQTKILIMPGEKEMRLNFDLKHGTVESWRGHLDADEKFFVHTETIATWDGKEVQRETSINPSNAMRYAVKEGKINVLAEAIDGMIRDSHIPGIKYVAIPDSDWGHTTASGLLSEDGLHLKVMEKGRRVIKPVLLDVTKDAEGAYVLADSAQAARQLQKEQGMFTDASTYGDTLYLHDVGKNEKRATVTFDPATGALKTIAFQKEEDVFTEEFPVSGKIKFRDEQQRQIFFSPRIMVDLYDEGTVNALKAAIKNAAEQSKKKGFDPRLDVNLSMNLPQTEADPSIIAAATQFEATKNLPFKSENPALALPPKPELDTRIVS